MNRSFVHLHNHTEFSMLDGAARVTSLVKAAAEEGMEALAITDHGYMFGAYEFWAAATKAGIKPIIGIEGYLTPGTHRTDPTRTQWGTKTQRDAGDDVSARGAYTHLTMWAETTAGMHNLFRLASLSSLEGQMGKWPRSDRELIQRFSPGLIGTTGCPSGEVQTRLRLGQWDEAVQAAADYRDIFGPGNYFLELMDHGIDIERRTRADLIRLGKHLDLPLVATNDLHYVHESDAHTHEAMLCINSGSLLTEPSLGQGGKRFAFDGSGYYLKSAAQMRELFREHPEACDNTLAIAERCRSDFEPSTGRYMPHAQVPPGYTEESYFRHLVEVGLRRIYGPNVPEDRRRQADYEMDVICSKGYAGYFIIVADFIHWAKTRGIRVGPGRGSGAGSTCAYAMGITGLDPITHGLLFERFLNPERASMPDFDIDFDDRRRDEVVQYVAMKYGAEYVSQIVTYGVFKTRNAIKDAARVLGHPYSLGDVMTKALPPASQGKDVPLPKLVDPTHDRYSEGGGFRQLLNENPDAAATYELAKGIEGITRQWGVHACGVIMSSAPLMDVIPIMKRPADGAMLTQFEYPACEALGLVKMDFLGLRNLTIVSDALDNIERAGKGTVTPEDLPLDDKETFALLARGDTTGVFQFDSAGYRELCRQMKPDKFGDISALGALYRPGPMGMKSHTNYALRKNGLQEITPLHPELEAPLQDVLAETYGLIVYQEQVMQIAQTVAGYTLGEADLLRRAMGKKKKDELDAQFVKFESGMTANGYSPEAVRALWSTLLPFADYAFNKSHSAAYGMVSYWTAYLKAHYPAEYMAALLTSASSSRDALAVLLASCRAMGITVLPPDINESRTVFTAVDGVIRFSFPAVSGVGEAFAATVIDVRNSHGRFTSFEDFVSALPSSAINKKTLEALIKAGAFDSLGHPRMGLMLVYEGLADDTKKTAKRQESGEFSLFDFEGSPAGTQLAVPIPDREWDRDQKLQFEREMLGLYVSDHPLNGLEEKLATCRDTEVADLRGLTEAEARSNGTDRRVLTLCGLLTGAERKVSKKGDAWAKLLLEDMSGDIECLVFPKTYAKVSPWITADSMVIVQGKVSYRDGPATLFVDDLAPMPA